MQMQSRNVTVVTQITGDENQAVLNRGRGDEDIEGTVIDRMLLLAEIDSNICCPFSHGPGNYVYADLFEKTPKGEEILFGVATSPDTLEDLHIANNAYRDAIDPERRDNRRCPIATSHEVGDPIAVNQVAHKSIAGLFDPRAALISVMSCSISTPFHAPNVDMNSSKSSAVLSGDGE
jgi:hypothetical protein